MIVNIFHIVKIVMKYTWYFIMISSKHEFLEYKFIYIFNFEQAQLLELRVSMR